MYYAGIDWADQHHDVVVIDHNGKQIQQFQVPHNRKGMETLKQKLFKLSLDIEKFACILETRNGLLVQFLLEAGFAVYPLNPKVVNYRRKPSGAKSDSIDARLLADIGRADLHRLHRLKRDSEVIEELKMLTRDQDTLIRELVRLKNRLIACLKEYYPAALEFFSHPGLPISLEFLKLYPTLYHVRESSVPEIAQFLKKHKHPKPNQTAISIFEETQKPQMEPHIVTLRAKSRLLLSLIAQLEPLLKEIEAYDKEIQRLFKVHSDSRIFDSLPGAGVRLAPRLLAEWGDDRGRYEDNSVVQALSGTSPVLYQSGKYRFARQRRSCIKPFRRALHLFSFQSICRVAWARKYYDSKRLQGKKHHEALRALANIWVRIIFSMWKKNTTYDESAYLEAKSKHGKAAA